MRRFVLDTSYAAAWLFADERDAESLELLNELLQERLIAVVPPHWFYEVASMLAVAERRGRLTPVHREEALRLLTHLKLKVAATLTISEMHGLLALCRATGLSPYDAVYLNLAVTEGEIPLATRDAKLSHVAELMRVRAQAPLFPKTETPEE